MFRKHVDIQEQALPEIIRINLHGEKPNPQWSNDLPIGWREITVEEFSQSRYFTYGAEYSEYRQAQVDGPDKPQMAFWVHWLFDGTGYAIAAEYWQKRIRYFACGCQHNYREFRNAEALAEAYPQYKGKGSFGMHDHTSVCEKCQHFMVTDSSG